MIGSVLLPALREGAHEVISLTRSELPPEGALHWDPSAERIDARGLKGVNAAVHLAGENIQGRWTPQKKQRIRDSRVQGTHLLAKTLAGLEQKPRAMVCASAVHYYGDRGDEVLREDSTMGYGFLAQVVREWERAADPARSAGIRVAHMRFGVVLSPEGGALGTTLPIFKLGGGGKIGSGRQWWSWVAIDDVVGAILHALETESVSGPVNVGSPNPVTNARYTKTLGRVLRRPTLFPLPATAARVMLGEVADELLLASARMEPARLKQTGYEFRHPELGETLRHLLGK